MRHCLHVAFFTAFSLVLGQATRASAGSSSPLDVAPASEPGKPLFSGSYQSSFNVSVLGDPEPSLGHRLNLSCLALGGSFDGRAEYYVEGSYNADPSGVLRNNINEPKFEGQLMYNRAVHSGFGVTVGFLYHHNFRFPDDYYWALAGLTYSLPIGEALTFSAAALGEKKLDGVRPFYDFSAALEYRFAPKWNAQLSYHRYENVGEFDPAPTQKQEYEIALNRALTDRQSVGVSFFRHIQFNAPNDQFSFVKLKYTASF